MAVRMGKQTMQLQQPVGVEGCAAIVGPMEGQGPLAGDFDVVLQDDLWGEKSWEMAESRMFEEAARLAMSKSRLTPEDAHILLGGDLLNQLYSANYAARQLEIPFLGLYGACSTMAESMIVGALLIDGGGMKNAVCVASSHFSSAERQYRLPLEMGAQRPPTAQRTVTGAGCAVLTPLGNPRITHVTIGKVVDFHITDTNNMGAAMAPAALDTLVTHLEDTGRSAEHYDLILTGDLAMLGGEVLQRMAEDEGHVLTDRYRDCGNLIFDPSQNVDCGGSGCGCSASVLNGHIIPGMRQRKWKRIFFMATGALMSPSSTLQGESIPGIAHGLALEFFE